MQTDEVAQKLKAELGFVVEELGSDRVVVETTGLEKFKRPNLQVAGIPKALAPVARRYMFEVAAYSVAVSPVKEGQTVGVHWAFGHNVVRAVGSKSAAAKKGWFGRRPPTLRLIPPQPGASHDAAPNLALATEILNHAHERAQLGEIEEAAHAAAWSIDIYPGESGIEARQPGYNMENYRAYEMLFNLTGQREYLDKALARSIDFQCETLGIAARALEALPEPAKMAPLVEAVRALVLGVCEKLRTSKKGEPHATMPCPVLVIGDEDALETGPCIVPKEYAGLYYEGAGRKALDDERTPLLVAEAAYQGRRDPGRLALLTSNPRTTWLNTRRDAHALEGVPCFGPEFLLSALLAEVARCGAAECSWEEIRARFGLEHDEKREKEAKAKLDALTQQANGWLDKVIERFRH